ncbi:MAG: hypothetical protein HF981_07315 [Desulfobacteraceae bacterium]|nr:hypothetical protein [Desulfobacteraceae bacterium]MBC2750177.1 STAS/SEC14 domain-containing protein [Desulfobacteraceae bacterium]
MGTIETKYDMAKDLTVATATGKMTADDHRKWIKKYYDDATVTSLILWDVREADFSEISNQDILDHVKETKQLIADARKGGKTAVVIDKDMLGLGLSRMRESYFEMEEVPVAMRTFTNIDEAMEWLGVSEKMATIIDIDKDRKIIQRTATGDLFTERSLELVRELAMALNTHRGYNVLMDMRETGTKPEMLDLMGIASACAKLRSDPHTKIAFLIPNTEERVRFAQLFKACMEAQGFRFRQFFDRDTAIEWLSEEA